MAAPMTTGVAALVVQAHPTWSPTRIKAAIMNTAGASSSQIVGYDPRLNGSVSSGRAGRSIRKPWRSSAGVEASMSFGYDAAGGSLTDTKTFTLVNTSGSAITYNLSNHFVGDDLGATVQISPSHVRVPAHGNRVITVRIRMTRADMADLPGADALPTEAVNVLEGAITANPTSSAAGRYPLRVPYLMVPRSLSALSAGSAGGFSVAAGEANGTIRLTNPGLHSGNADVYSLGLVDPNDGLREVDIRAVGVQSLPGAFGGLPDSDRLLGFAVNTYGRWTSAANNEVDVLVDTDRDGTPDFVVIAADSASSWRAHRTVRCSGSSSTFPTAVSSTSGR